ncbi:MAG: hypothetical protein KDB14_32895 [Planctomycetales bacterium]|nr:hypothetical protein [Planctomycetales bacterium]
MKRILLLGCAGLLTLLCGQLARAQQPSKPSEPSETIELGQRRELFLDDLLIGELDGTQLKMHEPHRLRRMPPRPFGHYATVLHDGDKLRLYYRGDKRPGAHWRNGWGQYHEGEVTLYAESSDRGVHWTEPNLGIHDVPEMPKGNVAIDMSDDTFLVTHNFTPFIDTRGDVPANERYKALGGGRYPPANWGGWKSPDERELLRKKYGPGGLKAFASADGLHWRLLQQRPVIDEELGSFDSQNGAFWSEAEQQYVCYFRWFDQGRRAIRRVTSPDFLNWSEPVDMQANEPGEHLYTSCTHPYFRAPHLYVALPTRFQASQGAITDIVLMATRPGSNRYHRHFKEAFLRPGLGERGWGNRANYITLNVVQTSPTEMSLFMYGGAQYVLRLDGFISIHAGHREGQFITKPFTFTGDRLELNYSTSGAGQLRVELQNAAGEPLPGFELESCDPLRGDAIAGDVTWSGKSELDALRGQTVRAKFVMKEADLYSMRFRQEN